MMYNNDSIACDKSMTPPHEGPTLSDMITEIVPARMNELDGIIHTLSCKILGSDPRDNFDRNDVKPPSPEALPLRYWLDCAVQHMNDLYTVLNEINKAV